MSFEKFLEGASKGLEEFIEVAKGEKDIPEAMEDIKNYFSEDEK
ncbi:hypothetical protein [Peribacillus asahii]|nr:hypothetical protein [Peribacillus asahii]